MVNFPKSFHIRYYLKATLQAYATLLPFTSAYRAYQTCVLCLDLQLLEIKKQISPKKVVPQDTSIMANLFANRFSHKPSIDIDST